jgi:hypothetical protein
MRASLLQEILDAKAISEAQINFYELMEKAGVKSFNPCFLQYHVIVEEFITYCKDKEIAIIDESSSQTSQSFMVLGCEVTIKEDTIIIEDPVNGEDILLTTDNDRDYGRMRKRVFDTVIKVIKGLNN